MRTPRSSRTGSSSSGSYAAFAGSTTRRRRTQQPPAGASRPTTRRCGSSSAARSRVRTSRPSPASCPKTSARSISSAPPPTSSPRRSTPPDALTFARETCRRPSRARRQTASPETSSFSRRPAPATTSSRTSRSAATRSAGSRRGCREAKGAPVRVEHARAGHGGPRPLRARDGLQRDLGLGRARRRQPARLRGAAGHLRVHRTRSAARRLAPRPRADPRVGTNAGRDSAHPLPGCARRRLAHQRRPPLDRRRAVRLPAVGARQARARRLDGLVPCESPPAGDAEGALGPIGLLVLGFAVLVLVEPDLGTALTLLLVVGAILLVSGTRLSLLASAYALVFGLAAIAAWSSPYRRDRLLTFLDPWKDPTGAGLQNVQALISMGSGGIAGRGLGQCIECLHYLPEAHTDMMFAVVGEELGLVGVSLLVAAFCAFAYAGIRLAIACRDPCAKRLAAGITALVCGQAAINMAAAIGVAPLTGIPLPFVSYGGSSLVVMLVGVGVLLNIARDGGRAAATVPDRGRRDGRTRRAGTGRRRSVASAGRGGDVRRVAGSRRGAARS